MVQHALYLAGTALDLDHQVRSFLVNFGAAGHDCDIAARLFEANLSKLSKQGDLKSSGLFHGGRFWASRTCVSFVLLCLETVASWRMSQ